MRSLVWLSIHGLVLAASALAQDVRLGVVRQMLPFGDDDTLAIAVGDFDGDGDPDIFVANDGPNRLLVNTGGGVYREDPYALPADIEETRGAALGDLDGDGDLDLVLANGGPRQSGAGQPDRVLLNDGNGRFAELIGAIPGPHDPSNAVALADVDGDRDLDALIVHAIDCTLFCRGIGSSLFLNDGSGRFTDATATHLGGGGGGGLSCDTSVDFGDVDGDRDLDAVVGGYGFQKGGTPTVLYRNDGTGRFAADAVGLPPFFEDTLDVNLVDIDGDGDLDLLEANGAPTGHGVPDRVAWNDGTGNFSSYVFPWGSGGDTYAHGIGDIDGDGDLDILAGDNWTFYDPNLVLLNPGNGVLTQDWNRLPKWIEPTRAVEMVDVDADGDLDALVFGLGPDHLHLNDGSGHFVEAGAGIPPRSMGTGAIGVADFDRDGNDDLLLTGDNRWGIPWLEMVVLLGDGTGTFENAGAALPATPIGARSLALGDVDGDGEVDALIGVAPWGGAPSLWLGEGDGGFTAANGGLPTNVDAVRALELADFDGDQKLDALFANRTSRVFWRGRGDGSFVDDSSALPSSSGSAWDLSIGDVEGDGDLDALFVGDGLPQLWLNDGAGNWSEGSAQLPLGTIGHNQVAFLDADGDRDLDFVLTSTTEVLLGRNDGAGHFRYVAGAFPAVTGVEILVVGDADDDGSPDVLLGRGQTNEPDPRIFRNDGTGLFTRVVDLPVGFGAMTAAHLGDLDGDGDTDALLCSSSGPDRLYAGLRSQLSWAGWPRVGQPLVLELHGEPASPWELAVALRELSFPAPPLGTLRIDPTTIVATACGSFDVEGSARVAFFVPNDPAFLGVSASWQHFQHAPARLSNLERTLPSGL